MSCLDCRRKERSSWNENRIGSGRRRDAGALHHRRSGLDAGPGVHPGLLHRRFGGGLPRHFVSVQAAGAELPHQYGLPEKRPVRGGPELFEDRFHVRHGLHLRRHPQQAGPLRLRHLSGQPLRVLRGRDQRLDRQAGVLPQGVPGPRLHGDPGVVLHPGVCAHRAL